MKKGEYAVPSRKEFLEYVLEQLSNLENITYKQMMGEYIIYYKGKIAAYVCDDRLLIILNTSKIQEKTCAEIQYIQDCRLDFFQILNGV